MARLSRSNFPSEKACTDLRRGNEIVGLILRCAAIREGAFQVAQAEVPCIEHILHACEDDLRTLLQNLLTDRAGQHDITHGDELNLSAQGRGGGGRLGRGI